MALLALLTGVLLLWMIACGWCGYHLRFRLFVTVWLAGLVPNGLWMWFGLDAPPFDRHALVAQATASAYALVSLACGIALQWGRRRWRTRHTARRFDPSQVSQ